MSHARTIPAALPVESRPLVSTLAEAVSLPRVIWLTVSGATLTVIGGTWDFAWHNSIGRDPSWAPPHIMVQTGALLVGIASIYAILAATFSGDSPARDASVRILGLRGPAGAFIGIWGSVAMFAAEQFDSWWHNAYGDTKIVTPPHSLLFFGSLAVKIGAMVWIASVIGRSVDALHGRLTWLFLFASSLSLMQLSNSIIGPTLYQNMHTAECYLAFALAIPPILLATGWGSRHKWGCTIAAAFYSIIGLASEWLVPLFPAQPKLGPVYHNVTHLIPMRFPLLLIVPAFVADLLLQKFRQQSPWIKAVYAGPALLLSFLAVQWPFANFLISPASRNWVFGTAYLSYQDPAGILYDPYKFAVAEKTLGAFLLTIVIAFVASIITTRLGLAWGDWMRRLQR